MTRRICPSHVIVLAASGLLTLAASNAGAACLPDPPMDGDTVTCDGTDSTGYDASSAMGLTINVLDTAVLDDSDPGLDSAILISTQTAVDIMSGDTSSAQITIMDPNGFGIRGGDDNGVSNNGTITINGLGGRGISLGSSTPTSMLGGVDNGGLIEAIADGSIAIEVMNDYTVRNLDTIDLTGDSTIGISARDRTNFVDFESSLSNTNAINVDGANSFGIRAGDGWNTTSSAADALIPLGSGIVNGRRSLPRFGLSFDSTTVINVNGDDSYGIFAGDLNNMTGAHNSFVTNTGTINVMGVDAIGVSLGGNDLLKTGDLPAVWALQNAGFVRGGPNAGPLVEFRDFDAIGENRVFVYSTGGLIADVANRNMIDRGIALLGSDGVEVLANEGVIQGDVLFGGGDDRYLQTNFSILDGTLDGGDGNDSALLVNASATAANFDVSHLMNFETLQIDGVAGWTLTNAAGYDGLTEILANGRLVVPTPMTLGGDLKIDPNGTLEVTLDGTMPPLTVMGTATLDGTLVVDAGPNLMDSATPYRVILANGGRMGEFSSIQVPIGGTRLFTPSYDSMGVLVEVFDVGLVGVARGATQVAIATHLQQIQDDGGGSQQVQDFITQLEGSSSPIQSAYVALSPEVYDAHTTVSFEGGRAVTDLLFDRPRECVVGDRDPWSGIESRLPCRPRSWSPWLAALGSFRSRDKFAGHPRYDAQLGGLAAGIDYRPIESVAMTFAIASQRGKINVAGGGDSTITLLDLAAQAAWTQGPLRIQGAFGWGHGFHKDRRLIQETVTSTPVDFAGVTNHDSNRFSLATEFGLAYDVGPIKVEPIAGLDWAFIDQGSIHEDEADGFGVRVESRDDDTGSVSAGVRLSTVYEQTRYLMHQLEWMDGVWRPMVDLRWRQVLAGNNRDVTARLEGAPDSVPDFTIKGKEDNGGLEIGAGVSFVPRNANRLQFEIRYDAYVASHTVAQNLTGQVSLGF